MKINILNVIILNIDIIIFLNKIMIKSLINYVNIMIKLIILCCYYFFIKILFTINTFDN